MSRRELLPVVLNSITLPTAQNGSTSPMKIRPVTCIHVAAYLFSALVLGVSVVSYHRGIAWTSNTYAGIFTYKGQLYFGKELDLSPEADFRVSFFDTYLFSIDFNWLLACVQEEQRFLCFARFVRCEWDEYQFTFYVVPISSFLLLPLAWICGFHLLKLRQRFRIRANNIQPSAP